MSFLLRLILVLYISGGYVVVPFTQDLVYYLDSANKLHFKSKLYSKDKLRLEEYDLTTIVKSAQAPLLWEKLKQKTECPVLNLPSRDQSPEDFHDDNSTSSQVLTPSEFLNKFAANWTKNKVIMVKSGLINEQESDREAFFLLQRAPQIYRLEPSLFEAALRILLKDIGMSTNDLKACPILLTYLPEHIDYGIRFFFFDDNVA